MWAKCGTTKSSQMDGWIESLQPEGVWTDRRPLYLVFGGKQLRSAASDITRGDREEEALEECDVKGRGGGDRRRYSAVLGALHITF